MMIYSVEKSRHPKECLNQNALSFQGNPQIMIRYLTFQQLYTTYKNFLCTNKPYSKRPQTKKTKIQQPSLSNHLNKGTEDVTEQIQKHNKKNSFHFLSDLMQKKSSSKKTLSQLVRIPVLSIYVIFNVFSAVLLLFQF